MRILLGAAAAAVCMMATPALAQQSPTYYYGSVGLTHMDAEVSRLEEAGKLGFEAATLRAGFAFNQYLALEAEGSIGLEDGTTHITDPDGGPDLAVKASLDHDASLFAVARLPMTDNANLFARVGYGTTRFSADVGDESGSLSTSGIRFGAGAEFFFTDADGVRIDFSRVDTDNLNSDAYTISYVRKFGVR